VKIWLLEEEFLTVPKFTRCSVELCCEVFPDGLREKQRSVFPTKLKLPAQAAFCSMLGKVIVLEEKFSKKLLEVPPLAVSSSRTIKELAVPGGTVTVTSKSALSPARRTPSAVSESVELPDTRALVNEGELTVVVAVSRTGEKSGPPGVDAKRATAVFVMTPPSAASEARSTWYCNVQVCP
jgi:hypothetical protein